MQLRSESEFAPAPKMLRRPVIAATRSCHIPTVIGGLCAEHRCNCCDVIRAKHCRHLEVRVNCMNAIAHRCSVALLSLAIIGIGLATAPAELPNGPPPAPPTPTPVVTLSPLPRMPMLPSPGRPSFSAVVRDEGAQYKVYVTVANAAPKDVQVTTGPKELKLVTLPDRALAKVTKVQRGEHTLTITIPKAAK